jgi:protein TonB
MEATQVLKSDFLDLLFEGKNQKYGAYALRRGYQKRLGEALLVTIAVVGLFILFFVVAGYLRKHDAVKPAPPQNDLVLDQVNIKQRDQPPPPLPPPAPEPPKVKPQVQYVPPQVVKDDQVKQAEEMPDIDLIKNRAISTVTKAGAINGMDPGLVADKGTGVVAAAPVTDRVFTYVQQMPSFPGGQAALMQYLRNHIRYPDIARENGIEGLITVEFIVGPDGTIRDVTTVGAKKGGGLEEEAIRVVSDMPKWTPGRQNGRAVTVQFMLPISFMLK